MNVSASQGLVDAIDRVRRQIAFRGKQDQLTHEIELNASGPDEGHSCRIGFIHRLQKRVDNYSLILRA